MPELFEAIRVNGLDLRNRVMRSATAEFLADETTGAPTPAMARMYCDLAEGGVALVVTGHACVEYGGRTHPRMAAMADDSLVSAWRETIRPAQALGARVMIQLNHGGASVDPQVVPDPISPSGVATNDLSYPRVMTGAEIEGVVHSFGQAARRAREAGFDGVQIHGAHGYLVTQFLSPATNRREDEWGGDETRRSAFLRAVITEVRHQVGADYPVWIKLGVAGRQESGLTMAEGARVAAVCAEHGIDCIEVSHGLGVPEGLPDGGEGRFLPMALAVRQAVGADYPLALVAGFRTLRGMERILSDGAVQIISICRPLIAEPNLPNKLQMGAVEVACVRCDLCRPRRGGDQGVACRNLDVRRRLA
jgi:2,4-dienoyl-CoA reductase-like NADH-dependent reductase (Old Yellow Enzyme family)